MSLRSTGYDHTRAQGVLKLIEKTLDVLFDPLPDLVPCVEVLYDVIARVKHIPRMFAEMKTLSAQMQAAIDVLDEAAATACARTSNAQAHAIFTLGLHSYNDGEPLESDKFQDTLGRLRTFMSELKDKSEGIRGHGVLTAIVYRSHNRAILQELESSLSTFVTEFGREGEHSLLDSVFDILGGKEPYPVPAIFGGAYEYASD